MVAFPLLAWPPCLASGSRWMHCKLPVTQIINISAHIRRIKTEEKAKVVVSVWGTEFIQLLAALAVLPRTI